MQNKTANILIILFVFTMIFFTHTSLILEELLIPTVQVEKIQSRELQRDFTLLGEVIDEEIIVKLTEEQSFYLTENAVVSINGKVLDYSAQNGVLSIKNNDNYSEEVFVDLHVELGEFVMTVPNSALENNMLFCVNEEKDGSFILKTVPCEIVLKGNFYTAISGVNEVSDVVKFSQIQRIDGMKVNVLKE